MIERTVISSPYTKLQLSLILGFSWQLTPCMAFEGFKHGYGKKVVRVFDTVRSSLTIIFKASFSSKLAVNNNYNVKLCKVNSNFKFNLKISYALDHSCGKHRQTHTFSKKPIFRSRLL